MALSGAHLDHVETKYCTQLSQECIGQLKKDNPGITFSINEKDGICRPLEMEQILGRPLVVNVARLTMTQIEEYNKQQRKLALAAAEAARKFEKKYESDDFYWESPVSSPVPVKRKKRRKKKKSPEGDENYVLAPGSQKFRGLVEDSSTSIAQFRRNVATKSCSGVSKRKYVRKKKDFDRSCVYLD